MSEEKTLRPCPCCGETHEFELEPIVEQDDAGNRRVRCQCCDLATQWVGPKEDYTAKMLWNKRPIEKDQELQIGTLYVEMAKTRAVLDEASSYLDLEGGFYLDPIEQMKKSLKVKPSSGIMMIAAERLRQIEKEGYTAEHDAKHGDKDFIDAALAYLSATIGTREDGLFYWPWNDCYFKPTATLRDLTKAGALIAAAIDRIQAE